MKPTRDVITDLLPLYFSGEASADTRALVEEYFASDPEFERMARRMAVGLDALKATIRGDDALEEQALVRARAQLRAKNMSLGAAIAGILAILLLVATQGTSNHALTVSYPLIIVACVAIFAILAKHTKKTGL